MVNRLKLHASMLFALSCLVVMASSAPSRAKPRRGIGGKPAPQLNAGTWFNVEKAKVAPELLSPRGHVVGLFFLNLGDRVVTRVRR